MNILTVVLDGCTFRIQRKTGSAIFVSDAAYETYADAFAVAQRRAAYVANTVVEAA